MQSKVKVVSVVKECALRHNAERLFETIRALPSKDVLVDFSDVKSVSRSFAQEYLEQKKGLTVTETGMNEDVQAMFNLVKKPRTGERFDFSEWKEERLPC